MSHLGTFTHGIARKLGYLVAVVIFGIAAAYFNPAKAQVATLVPRTCSAAALCDQGKANAECRAHMKEATDAGYTVYNQCTLTVTNATTGKYTCYLNAGGAACTSAGSTFNYGSLCASRTNLANGYIKGNSDVVCNQGCQYTTQGRGKVNINFGALGEGWTQSVAGFAPTGLVCNTNTETPAEKEECLPIAGQSVCKRTDGKICYSASTGRRICWVPGEVGQQTDGNIAQTKALGATPIPANVGQPTQPTGEQPITTNTTTTNSNNSSTTTTTTTTNYITTGGGPAGGSNQGEGTNVDGTGTGSPGGTTGGTGEGTDMTETNAKLDGIKGTLDGIKAWWDGLGTEAAGMDDSQGEDVTGDEAWQDEEEEVALDSGGYGFGSSCPNPPSIDVPGGGQLDWSLLCTMAQAFGTLILAAAYVQAAFVIGRT